MSFGISTYAAQKLQDHALGVASFTAPSSVYVALYTAAPNAGGGGTECSGNGYARQVVTFASASGPSLSNITATFPTATPSGWGDVVAMSIMDASSSGHLLFFCTFTPVTINVGYRATISSGSISVQIG